MSNPIYIYDQIGGTGIQAIDIVKEIAGETDVEVHINSGGGSVSQGIAIYNSLKQHDGQVNVFVDGLAASIASVIALAGDTVTMAEGSLLMVHLPWTQIAGNAEDLRKEAEVLDQHKETLIDIYASNSQLGRDEIEAMLSEETWLTAEEAYELGLITGIAGELKQAASVNIDSFNNAPNSLLDILNLEPEAVDATISITFHEAFEETKVNDNLKASEEADNFARLEAAHQRLAIITKLASL
jgi:ATP-dependent Clp endopeptidase proteolytic subunit ClpP